MPSSNGSAVWGRAVAALYRARRFSWVDLAVAVGLMGLLYGIVKLASEWTAPHQANIEIDLSPWALPRYTFFSLSRGPHRVFDFARIYAGLRVLGGKGQTRGEGFDSAARHSAKHSRVGVSAWTGTGVGGRISAEQHRARAGRHPDDFYRPGVEHDVQFLPLGSFGSVGPTRSGHALPFQLVAALKWVELPFSTMGLVWNSMMSMAGGWFFLMIDESYRLGNQDFRLPGIGSYMQVAVDKGRVDAMVWAMLAMLLMIVGLDQILWRPVVVWAQKFRVEETCEQVSMTSWLLEWLRRSRLLAAASKVFARVPRVRLPKLPHVHRPERSQEATNVAKWMSLSIFGLLLVVLGVGSWRLLLLLRHVTPDAWGRILSSGFVTLIRVIVATAAGTLWALPAGLAIGLSPRLSRIFQPIVQVAASFPAPMLFPLVIAGLSVLGVSLNFGAVLLMLLGTQWYILFNVIAGAIAIPGDLRETARSYQLSLWQRFANSLYSGSISLPCNGLGDGGRRRMEREHRRRVCYVQRKGAARLGIGRSDQRCDVATGFPRAGRQRLGDGCDRSGFQPCGVAPNVPSCRTKVFPEQVILGRNHVDCC